MKQTLKDLKLTLNVNEQATVLHALKQLEVTAGGNLKTKTALNDLISRIQTAQIEVYG